MADEFFRPYFGSGIYAVGEALPGLWYNATLSNNNSILGVKASQLDRKYTSGGSIWWMPTTHEFGPRGAYGDWEMHDEVATRFGLSYTKSPEQDFRSQLGQQPREHHAPPCRQRQPVRDRLARPRRHGARTRTSASSRSTPASSTRGSSSRRSSTNAGSIDSVADGPLPVNEIVDRGFYVQAAFYPIPAGARALRPHVADLRRQGRRFRQQLASTASG